MDRGMLNGTRKSEKEGYVSIDLAWVGSGIRLGLFG